MPDDVIFTDELTDPDTGRVLRISITRDGSVFVTIENMIGLLSPTTMIGGAGLLVWLQANAEAGLHTWQRHDEREVA